MLLKKGISSLAFTQGQDIQYTNCKMAYFLHGILFRTKDLMQYTSKKVPLFVGPSFKSSRNFIRHLTN